MGSTDIDGFVWAFGYRKKKDVNMSLTLFDQVAFLDFEASSLDYDSWPIEVGLSWINAECGVETCASPIRSAPD